MVTEKDGLPRLQKRVTPGIFWSVMVEIGFLGWIGAVIGAIVLYTGGREKAQYHGQRFFVWMTFTAIFFSIWILGMMKA